MESIVIKDKKDRCLLSHGSSIFIKSITKEGDVYSGCISNMGSQNINISPAAIIVYYNKRDINGIFLEESTGNELHSIFHYKILGIEIEKIKKERKESPMAFDGCEI